MPVEDEKDLARGGNQAVSQRFQSAAAETEGLSAIAPEWEAARLRAYRQARIFEPNMESYYAAMSVYTAAFGKPDGEVTVLLPDGTEKQSWEL